VRLETLEKRTTVAQFTTPDVEFNIVSDEPDRTQNNDTDNAKEVGAEVVGEMVEVVEDVSQVEEIDGVWGDGAGDKEIQNVDASLNVIDNTLRDEIVKITNADTP